MELNICQDEPSGRIKTETVESCENGGQQQERKEPLISARGICWSEVWRLRARCSLEPARGFWKITRLKERVKKHGMAAVEQLQIH